MLFCLWWLFGWLGAYAATQPHPAQIRDLHSIVGHEVKNVEVRTADGLLVRAWLVGAASTSTRCVILAAGIRGNRQSMLSRADFYLELGWSVLLVDLRGTGSSDRARISMGWHEALDLVAWYQFLLVRGFEAIGVHGQSLGAAAAAYSSVRASYAPRWSFVVLEACYRDIDAALRARVFDLPSVLLLPMMVCAEWLLDLRAADLDPVAAMQRQPAPLLVACGTRDDRVGAEATTLLLAASPADDKVRHDVVGAGHADLWQHPGGDELRKSLRDFLRRR